MMAVSRGEAVVEVQKVLDFVVVEVKRVLVEVEVRVRVELEKRAIVELLENE
jgi:hypothetical protein